MIDVREDEEVAQGMIDGAKHIPLGQIPDRLSEIDKSGEIILICRAGYRSERACEYLRLTWIRRLYEYGRRYLCSGDRKTENRVNVKGGDPFKALHFT